MPELPEVETVRRGLAPVMEGSTIFQVEQRRENLRFPFPEDFVARLEGRRIVSLGRRAKYLLVDLDDGTVLIMHLGMSGSFRTVEGDLSEEAPGNFHYERSKVLKHDHVVFHLNTASENAGNEPDPALVIYNDPRRFGFMTLCRRSELETHPLFAGMGVEPVGNSLSSEVLAEKLSGKSAPLKAALLDQRVIAGLGNIYVCEALWRSELSPRRKSSTLVLKSGKPTQRLEHLVVAIRDVIAEAIKAGGSSLRDHRQTDGTLGYFQHRFSVYDRENEPCKRNGCEGKLSRIVQSGRSTFFCPRCQR